MNDATSAAALAGRYDAIAYAAQPSPWSQPGHLAAVATLFGLDPPPAASARVLEVGCSDGANLIPMAVALPGATFVGCDLAARPIAEARRTVEATGLSNIRFEQADLAELRDDFGPFDYIVAHGVYSWVPAPVRDALFALAARRLAPNGVMFVSYNTLPGCRVRQAAWDALAYHTRGITEPRARLDAARALGALLAEPGTTNEDSDAALRAEFARIATRPDSPLFHDDLGEPNDPVHFHEFVAHAGRHGLAFVAESALSSTTGDGLSPRMRAFADGCDRLAREQYLDFAHLRRYRQSLLCHASSAGALAWAPQRIAAMQVSASTALMRAAAEGRFTGGDARDAMQAVLQWLAGLAPRAVAVADARDWLARRAGGAVPPVAIEDLLADACRNGLVQLHTTPLRLAATADEHPVASPLVRWQAIERDYLTNLRHEAVRVADPLARQLLPLLDGSRSRRQLVEALGPALSARERKALADKVDGYLKAFARLALLMPA